MAYKVIKSKGSVQGMPKRVFICDTEGDIASLPTNKTIGAKQENDTVSDEICAVGSIASVSQTGNKYELSAGGEWILKPSTGSSEETPGSGSTIVTDTTLSQSGKAADAKAVGDALGQYLKSDEAQKTYVNKIEAKNYVTTDFMSSYLSVQSAKETYVQKTELEGLITEENADSKYASKKEFKDVLGNPASEYKTLESIGNALNLLDEKVEVIRKTISTSTSILLDGDSIQEAISNPNISTVALVPGTFSGELTLSKSINLVGYNSTTPANEGSRCSDTIDDNETIIDGTLNIEGNSDVVLSGLTFTENALINTSNQGTLTLSNCKILGMEADAAKSYLIKNFKADPLKLTVENCYFGTNAPNSVGNIYNGLELNCALKDGSSISNNYFAAGACTHNAINIYDVEDGATIYINGNHFEYSGNAIRIGIKGEPECTIVCDGNSYDATDSYVDYAGLLLVQPYDTQTTSFANCTIKINNTTHNDDNQVYYLYAGAGDMQFTNSNKPTIIVNGITEVQPSI